MKKNIDLKLAIIVVIVIVIVIIIVIIVIVVVVARAAWGIWTQEDESCNSKIPAKPQHLLWIPRKNREWWGSIPHG